MVHRPHVGAVALLVAIVLASGCGYALDTDSDVPATTSPPLGAAGGGGGGLPSAASTVPAAPTSSTSTLVEDPACTTLEEAISAGYAAFDAPDIVSARALLTEARDTLDEFANVTPADLRNLARVVITRIDALLAEVADLPDLQAAGPAAERLLVEQAQAIDDLLTSATGICPDAARLRRQ